MKSLYYILLAALILPTFAEAKRCERFLEVQPVGNYLKKDIEIPTQGQGDWTNKLLVKDSVKKLINESFDGNTFDDAIEQVYLHLKNRTDLNGMQKAAKLSKMAQDLNPILETMLQKVPAKGTAEAPDLVAWAARKKVLDQVKTVKYSLARKVSSFEEFAESEFKMVKPEDLVLTRGDNFEKLTHMKMKDYPKYVDSYLHHIKNPDAPEAALYKNIDQGTLGILSIDDIRDITAYSVWPMYYKSHDIKHIHYALTHPMALAAMMGTTRSKNHLRYALMAGLYEGVDRVQYGHETALNKFFAAEMSTSEIFKSNRNMDLEEAMLTIALATEKELDDIAKKVGVELSSNSSWGLFKGIENWVPKRVQGGKVNGRAFDGESFEREMDDMVAQYSKLLDRSEKIKAQLLEKPDMILSKEDEHFMKMMNFQLDPESPEIVIDGLRFKNDGRAHSYSGDQSRINIGIGDQ